MTVLSYYYIKADLTGTWSNLIVILSSIFNVFIVVTSLSLNDANIEAVACFRYFSFRFIN